MFRMFFINAILMLSSSGYATAAISDQELQSLYKTLIEKVYQAQNSTNDLILHAKKDPTKVEWLSWLPKIDDAVMMLQIKYALAWDFRGSPALKSVAVREKLLSIMDKDNITDEDLESLRTLINIEMK